MRLKNVWGGLVPVGSNIVHPGECVPVHDREYTKQEKADINLFTKMGYLVEDEPLNPQPELQPELPTESDSVPSNDVEKEEMVDANDEETKEIPEEAVEAPKKKKRRKKKAE